MHNQPTFQLPLRIYIEDTDCGGIVYHSKYLNFMERSRTEWLNEVGILIPELAQQGCYFVIRSAEINYLKPMRLNDQIDIIASIQSSGRSSITFQHSIHQQNHHDTIYCTGQVKVVTVGDNGRPIRLPTLIKEKLLCQNPAYGAL